MVNTVPVRASRVRALLAPSNNHLHVLYPIGLLIFNDIVLHLMYYLKWKREEKSGWVAT